MIGRFVDWVRALPTWARWYWVAVALWVVSIPLNAPWKAYIATAGTAAVAIGFYVRLMPVLIKILSTWPGKAVFAALNVTVLLAARVGAHKVVALGLGLPPEEFEQTVNILTAFLILPVASVIASYSLGALTLVLFLWGFWSHLFRQSQAAGLVAWGHAMGALAVVTILSTYMTSPLKWVERAPAWLPRLAYEADFHVLHNLPGAPEGQRVHVLDEGRLAVATIENGLVVIRVIPAVSAGTASAETAEPR